MNIHDRNGWAAYQMQPEQMNLQNVYLLAFQPSTRRNWAAGMAWLVLWRQPMKKCVEITTMWSAKVITLGISRRHMGHASSLQRTRMRVEHSWHIGWSQSPTEKISASLKQTGQVWSELSETYLAFAEGAAIFYLHENSGSEEATRKLTWENVVWNWNLLHGGLGLNSNPHSLGCAINSDPDKNININ